jgi:Trypsin-like serine proteases, typically periplasmic, contain C-terminal PDZ domain
MSRPLFFHIHLRVNAPTQRGEAGAPLLNMKGEVVGIVVSGLENNAACYAVPIEAARKFAATLFASARPDTAGSG